MMEFRRRRPSRVHPGGHRPGSGLEQLEARQLLTAKPYLPFFPTTFIQAQPQTGSPAIYQNHPYGTGQRQLSFLDNEGKILTGKDRAGNEWQITVHGPGVVIVTDATPNDGALDDDIDTIQLVGTDPNRTVVTGNVVASARVLSDSTVTFNHLISLNGVATIKLNGFNLARTVTQPTGTAITPEIYLPGGVRDLEFNNIIAQIDTSAGDTPFNIVIGDPAHPLTFKPTIKIGSVFNTVFDSTQSAITPGVPVTTPTVNILVNGALHNLQMTSATAQPIPAGVSYALPTTSVTGRTAIRATSIDNVKIVGSARNTTLSKEANPFSNGLTGLNRLGSLTVGGVTDGLGVDVSRGSITHLRLQKGLGDPTGSTLTNPTTWGSPVSQYGNAAFGLYGGLVVARRIGRLTAGPANTTFQGVQDPDLAQIRVGSTRYFMRAGQALTNAAVVTDGSIGQVTVVGNLVGSEIKTGTNYASYVAGLEAVRSASRINRLRIRGNLIDSVVSATYRTGPDKNYGTFNEQTGTTDDQAGPGVISGNLQQGALYTAGGKTILGNTSVGFFARIKQGFLPPPQGVKRINSVNLGL